MNTSYASYLVIHMNTLVICMYSCLHGYVSLCMLAIVSSYMRTFQCLYKKQLSCFCIKQAEHLIAASHLLYCSFSWVAFPGFQQFHCPLKRLATIEEEDKYLNFFCLFSWKEVITVSYSCQWRLSCSFYSFQNILIIIPRFLKAHHISYDINYCML